MTRLVAHAQLILSAQAVLPVRMKMLDIEWTHKGARLVLLSCQEPTTRLLLSITVVVATQEDGAYRDTTWESRFG
jgi:hypothetical protein